MPPTSDASLVGRMEGPRDRRAHQVMRDDNHRAERSSPGFTIGCRCCCNPDQFDHWLSGGMTVEELRPAPNDYPAPKPPLISMSRIYQRFLSVQLLQKTLEINTQSMEQLRTILFKTIATVRISD